MEKDVEYKEVKYIFVEKLHCKKCKEELVWNGKKIASTPTRFPHVCPNCNFKRHVKDIYPRIVMHDRYGKKIEFKAPVKNLQCINSSN